MMIIKKFLLTVGIIASININAVLGPINIYLNPVNISSNAFNGLDIEATFSSEVYTADDIKKTNSSNIYDFLNQNTSIAFVPSFGNKFAQKIDMRGFGLTDGYQHIVVIINNRRLNNIDTAISSLSGIAINSIEKIEIIKGSGSVVYGDSATAGVIKITTKNINNIKLKLGNYGYKMHTISFAENKEKIEVSVLFNKITSNGYSDDTDGNGNTDSGKQDNQNFNFKYLVNNKIDFGFSLEKNHIDNYYSSYLSGEDFNNNPAQLRTGANFTHNIVNSNVINFNTNYVNNGLKLSFNLSNENKDITTFSINNYLYKLRKLQLDYKFDNFKTLIGYDLFNGTRRDNSSSFIKNNNGIFIQSSYNTTNILYSLGLRSEKVKYSYNLNTGSFLTNKHSLNAFDIGFNKKINNTLSIFSNYNKSFHAPLVDRFFRWNTGFTSQIFNEFIEPTKVKTFNIGLSYSNYKHKIKLTLFRSNLKNEMYYYKIGAFSGKNTNLDKSHKQGVELQYKRQFNNTWKININYSFIDAIIDKENEENSAYNDKDLPMSSRHNITASIIHNINDKSSIILIQKYRSSAFAEEDFSNSFTQKQKAFKSTNLKYSYKYSDNLKFSVNIENLFKSSYGTWLRNNVIYPSTFTRNINLGLSYKF